MQYEVKYDGRTFVVEIDALGLARHAAWKAAHNLTGKARIVDGLIVAKGPKPETEKCKRCGTKYRKSDGRVDASGVCTRYRCQNPNE